jgi:hypothetical protein
MGAGIRCAVDAARCASVAVWSLISQLLFSGLQTLQLSFQLIQVDFHGCLASSFFPVGFEKACVLHGLVTVPGGSHCVGKRATDKETND